MTFQPSSLSGWAQRRFGALPKRPPKQRLQHYLIDGTNVVYGGRADSPDAAGRHGRPRPAAGDAMFLRDREYSRSRFYTRELPQTPPGPATGKRYWAVYHHSVDCTSTYDEEALNVFYPATSRPELHNPLCQQHLSSQRWVIGQVKTFTNGKLGTLRRWGKVPSTMGLSARAPGPQSAGAPPPARSALALVKNRIPGIIFSGWGSFGTRASDIFARLRR